MATEGDAELALGEWKTIGVSVAGFSHLAERTPCQDFHLAVFPAKGWLVAIVSDGAGSASRAAEGAKAICEGLAAALSKRLVKHTTGVFEEATCRTWIVDAVELVRTKLVQEFPDHALSAFHATLVGVIAGPEGGVFFHVGDGSALATDTTSFSPSVMSLPENGEFANDTYFFTQDDWTDHLRLTSFGREFDLVALMSDGVTPFALAPGAAGPHIPFFAPLSKYLAEHSEDEGREALAATLGKDTIRRITGDDKSLIWARRIVSRG
jgi:hypothetical protein